jgi:hypothetical protein
MRFLAAVLLLSSAVTAASAGEARFATFQAPDGNVVELRVNDVAVPTILPGVCTVEAGISKVWFGTAFHAGQVLTLDVPCDGSRLIQAASFDGVTPVNAEALRRSRRAIVRLDDEGKILWQSNNLTPYGGLGTVTGYRVLDGQLMPLTRS